MFNIWEIPDSNLDPQTDYFDIFKRFASVRPGHVSIELCRDHYRLNISLFITLFTINLSVQVTGFGVSATASDVK